MLTLIIGLAIIIALDHLRLHHRGQKIIQQEIGPLITPYPDKIARIVTYVALTLGLYIFALTPANGWLLAAVYGGLFGMIVSTVHQCTSQTHIDSWTRKTVIFGIAQMMIICGIANLIMFITQ